MNVSRKPFKLIASVMAAIVFTVSIPTSMVQAGLVNTEQVIGETAAKEKRARVLNFLQREDVRKQMIALGVQPDEAAARVHTLSDAEIRQVAGHLDKLPAGQNAIAAIVGAIVLVFIILLITDLLGWTDIFPFVKKQKR